MIDSAVATRKVSNEPYIAFPDHRSGDSWRDGFCPPGIRSAIQICVASVRNLLRLLSFAVRRVAREPGRDPARAPIGKRSVFRVIFQLGVIGITVYGIGFSFVKRHEPILSWLSGAYFMLVMLALVVWLFVRDYLRKPGKAV